MKLTKEELKEKVLEYDWELWLSREFGAFILSLFIGSNSRAAMRKVGVDVEQEVALCEYTWYESKKAFEEMFEDIKKELASGNTIKKISESCERYRDESKIKLKELLQYGGKSNREKFIEAMEIIKPVYSYIWLAHDFEYYLTPIFKEKFSKYFDGDIDKIIGDLSFPVKKNSHVLLEEALLAGRDTKELAEEFGWMKARDGFSDPYTEQELIDLREKFKMEERQEPLKIDVPISITHEVEESREIVYFRTLRTDVMFELLYIARPIIKAMGEDFGIEFRKLKNYSVYDLIEGKPKEYPESLVCAYYKDQAYFYEEPILEKKEVETSEIRGMIAFSGKVTGPAKIVDKLEEIGKVEEGDILVTHMTVPSFVMAMKKAAGFVTNEGGLTCHAAIIAREMRKPCITGTKIATKVLHDGDMIEVDAERGIVRKLTPDVIPDTDPESK